MVKPYLGKAATTYDKKREKQRIWKVEERLLSTALDQYGPLSVVDIPVGTGRFLPLYKKKGIDCIGIDLSPDMLRVARQKEPSADLREGDVLSIPLEDDVVDMVICFRLLYFLSLPQVEVAAKELTRVGRNRVLVTARFTHKGGPKAPYVITHDKSAFFRVWPDGWEVASTQVINSQASDEYLMCEIRKK